MPLRASPIGRPSSLPLDISPQIKALENRRQRFSIDPSATAIGHLPVTLA